jgi:hypothetical protein
VLQAQGRTEGPDPECGVVACTARAVETAATGDKFEYLSAVLSVYVGHLSAV